MHSYAIHGSSTVGKINAVLAAIALLIVPILAQTLSPAEVRIRSWPYHPFVTTVRVQTNEVQLGVVVRDSKGHIVSGLTRNDFAIYDNRRQQPVSSFLVEKRQLPRPEQEPPVSAVTQLDAQPSAPPRPRYVALYFDDLDTEFGYMRRVQLAAENFIHTGVSPDDKIALFTASGLQSVDFNQNTSPILDAIEDLKFHGRAIKSNGCPRITPYDAYVIVTEPNPPIVPQSPYSNPNPQQGSPTYQAILGEAIKCNCVDTGNMDRTCDEAQRQVIQSESQEIWDSVRQMSQDVLNTLQTAVNDLAEKPGERVLVLASSGFLAGTLEDKVDSILNDALHAAIVINVLDAKGLYTYTETEAQAQFDGHDATDANYRIQSFGQSMMTLTAAMVDFTVGTGGRFFHNRNDLSAGYYSLAAAPQTEYLLGFVPENAKANGAFHKLKVELTIPGKFDIQARPGYFVPTKETQASHAPTPEQMIDAEVSSTKERSDFPLAVNDKPLATSGSSHAVSIQTHVGIQKLPLAQEKDRHVDMLTFVAALFDSQGKLAAGKEAQMQFALKPESFDRLSKTGINGAMSLEAPAGTYRLRVVVEEAMRGEMSATTRNIQIQ